MSSTVTTATVAVVSSAVSIPELGQVLTLLAVLALALVLLAKEIAAVSKTRFGRGLSRGLDIGLVPLLAVFGLIIALNLMMRS